jgi:two-component system, OmpR family, sensor kinase
MSSGAEPVRGGRSIAAPIFALVIAAVVIAALFNFAITFSGPPPKEPPRGTESIAHLLRTGEQPGDPGPRLRLWRSASRPAAPSGTRADPAAAARLARKLGVPPAAVIAFTAPGRQQFDDAFLGRFLFGWRTAGEWRVVENPRPPTFMRWHWVTLASMLGAVLALAVPAWLLAQTLARPLQQLAVAAGRARPGAALALPTGGSKEVRALAVAVGQMHGRLAGHARGRTAMLAAIAHDLGTPLSRLAFRVEQLPEAARAKAAADIAEMRGMIAAALRFARDELAGEGQERVEVGSLLDSLAENMRDAGADVVAKPGPRAIVRGDPGALRRLFQNLLDNAVRYGGAARVAWTVAGETLEVAIEDAGPGIDPAQAEALFEPFVRGDPSRNRATGGTGLGLAIVRSIAERHGGTATLGNGVRGAVARVVLPLAG